MGLKNIYSFILSFMAGIAFSSLFIVSLPHLLFVGTLTGVFFILLYIKKVRIYFLFAILSLGFLLGSGRFLLETHNTTYPLDPYIGTDIEITGVIVAEPEEKAVTQQVVIEVITVFNTEIFKKVRLTTNIDRYPEYEYGDKVMLHGTIERPKNFITDSGRIFNYISFLEKDNISYISPFPEVTLLSKNNGNPVKSFLFKMKHKWLSKIQEVIPEPQVSLLGGLVVGAEESLGKELEDNFRKTGIIHIVVLSGYNVTIVAEAFMRLLSFLPHVVSLSFGAVSIVFFAIMTGASATIVRASIMALFVLLARSTGRISEATHALFLAGFLMIFHNPHIVMYDPSFQLSFLATLGLIHGGPLIEKYFKLVPQKFQLREFAIATVSTQILVLPLLLFMMGELSLVSLPVNLLVLVFIPITMLFGFLTGLFAFIHPLLAFPFGVISHILLSYELFIVDIFAHLPFTSVSIPYFPWWLMVSFYIMYGYIFYTLQKNKTK